MHTDPLGKNVTPAEHQIADLKEVGNVQKTVMCIALLLNNKQRVEQDVCMGRQKNINVLDDRLRQV